MIHNKFIEQYPQFWIPEIGDRVKVIKIIKFEDKGFTSLNYYDIGDIGTVRQYSEEDQLLLVKMDKPTEKNRFVVLLKFELEPIYE